MRVEQLVEHLKALDQSLPVLTIKTCECCTELEDAAPEDVIDRW